MASKIITFRRELKQKVWRREAEARFQSDTYSELLSDIRGRTTHDQSNDTKRASTPQSRFRTESESQMIGDAIDSILPAKFSATMIEW